MDSEKLRDVIDEKIKELENQKIVEVKSLNYSEFYYTSDLETLGNILICDSKIELLNELLDMID